MAPKELLQRISYCKYIIMDLLKQAFIQQIMQAPSSLPCKEIYI